MKKAAPGTFMLMYGSPLELIGRLQQKPIPGQAPAPPSQQGLAVTAGAKAGVMHIVLDVPADQARALAQTVMRMGGRL